jgi:hypothetical protein
MAYEQRENSGSLFKNNRREQENHPHATGSALIGGVNYWVSAWTKTDKNGNNWQSLAFKPKDTQSEAKRTTAPNDGGLPVSNDIPW